jgi:hypothetical protein
VRHGLSAGGNGIRTRGPAANPLLVSTGTQSDRMHRSFAFLGAAVALSVTRPAQTLGPLSNPTTAAQCWRWEPLFMPHTCRSRYPPGSAQLGGELPFVPPPLVGCATINIKVGRISVGHSMTSSARARIDGGIVRPSVFAVFRLITSSNFVGCSTGRSAGFAPFKILST